MSKTLIERIDDAIAARESAWPGEPDMIKSALHEARAEVVAADRELKELRTRLEGLRKIDTARLRRVTESTGYMDVDSLSMDEQDAVNDAAAAIDAALANPRGEDNHVE